MRDQEARGPDHDVAAEAGSPLAGAFTRCNQELLVYKDVKTNLYPRSKSGIASQFCKCHSECSASESLAKPAAGLESWLVSRGAQLSDVIPTRGRNLKLR